MIGEKPMTDLPPNILNLGFDPRVNKKLSQLELISDEFSKKFIHAVAAELIRQHMTTIGSYPMLLTIAFNATSDEILEVFDAIAIATKMIGRAPIELIITDIYQQLNQPMAT
jgi:hypothetical protein